MQEFAPHLRPFASSLIAIVGLTSGLLIKPDAAEAQQGIYLPQAPRGSGGEDMIETQGGARCRQSINSSGAYLDVGLAGSTANNEGGYDYIPGFGRPSNSQTGMGYARITIPLGKKPKRIDCSKIYEMEIARMQREIELLQIAAE